MHLLLEVDVVDEKVHRSSTRTAHLLLTQPSRESPLVCQEGFLQPSCRHPIQQGLNVGWCSGQWPDGRDP